MTYEERIALLSQQIAETSETLARLHGKRDALQAEHARSQRTYLQKAADAALEEAGHQVRDGEPIYYAPNGEPYICLTNGGEKAEGAMMPAFADTPEQAVEDYLARLRVYADGLPGVCWWRWRPEFRVVEGRFAVYSRLLIVPA